jgi:hypothetical protein
MGRPGPSARTRTRPELPVTVAGDRRAKHEYRGLWTPRRHRPIIIIPPRQRGQGFWVPMLPSRRLGVASDAGSPSSGVVLGSPVY